MIAADATTTDGGTASRRVSTFYDVVSRPSFVNNAKKGSMVRAIPCTPVYFPEPSWFYPADGSIQRQLSAIARSRLSAPFIRDLTASCMN